MKDLWEKSQKEQKKSHEVKNKLEDENVALKVRLEKMEKEHKELKDYMRIKDKF